MLVSILDMESLIYIPLCCILYILYIIEKNELGRMHRMLIDTEFCIVGGGGGGGGICTFHAAGRFDTAKI